MVREGLVNSEVSQAEHISGPRPLTGIKILDVGCGGGILCEVSFSTKKTSPFIAASELIMKKHAYN